jgi:multiple antibiotic resistance protein
MIFPGKDDVYSHNEEAELLIVPLAVLLLAGPSAIAAVILMMAQEPDRWQDWALLVLIVAWIIAGVILVSSETLGRKLGVSDLIAIERLMGILLLLVSVNMLVEGIKQSFNV